MENPEKIYKRYKSFITAVTKEEAIRVISQIQKDAYDSAIADSKYGGADSFMGIFGYVRMDEKSGKNDSLE